MKRHIFILTLLFLAAFQGFSQVKVETPKKPVAIADSDAVSTTDPILIKKDRFTSFYQKGEKLSASLIREVVVNSPEAVKEMNQARKNYLASIGFNTVGSFLVAYPLASTIFSGSKLDWQMLGVGAGFIGVGIPFTKAYIRHATKAAEIHNQRLKKSASKPAEVQVGLAGAGLGFKLTF